MDLVGETAKFVVSSVAGIVLMTHANSWRPLYYIASAVLNGVFCKLLKRLFRIPRPPNSVEGGYGMPSSHTQVLFYFVSILSSLLLNEELAKTPISILLVVALVWLYALTASAWRVKGGLHTTAQTLVGGALGFMVGLLAVHFEDIILNRFQEFTSNHVPLWLRAFVCLFGALVVYKREIFDFEKRLHRHDVYNNKAKQHVT